MSNFIDSFGNKALGFPKINLDHVAELRPVKNEKSGKWDAFDCYTATGERLGRIEADEISSKPSAIVPETSGALLVSFYHQDDGSLYIQRIPILAWMIHEDSAHTADPITCELPPDPPWAIEFQQPKTWLIPEFCSFESFEDLEKYARETIEARNKRKAI